jgi:hypothetical protein
MVMTRLHHAGCAIYMIAVIPSDGAPDPERAKPKHLVHGAVGEIAIASGGVLRAIRPN